MVFNSLTFRKHMSPRSFVGMDLHKQTSTFYVKDYDGRTILGKKILTDRAQVTEFISSIPSTDIAVTMEPVSQWYVYADLMQSLGCDVHLAHPM